MSVRSDIANHNSLSKLCNESVLAWSFEPVAFEVPFLKLYAAGRRGGAARRRASVQETRDRFIQCFSLSTPLRLLTDQNRRACRFCSLCHQITPDKCGENCLIDEQSDSLHVINTLLMATHLFSIVWRTQEGVCTCVCAVRKAPKWPRNIVKDCVSFPRFCYLMPCREASGTK